MLRRAASAIANSRHKYELPQVWPTEDNFDHLPTSKLEEVLGEAITNGVTYEYEKNTCKLHLSKRDQRGAFKLPSQLDKAKEFIESVA